jgi:hypothetical protein
LQDQLCRVLLFYLSLPLQPILLHLHLAKMVYTTSNVFLETLILAGITHAFVNLGSDHPALLEAIADRAGQDGKDLKIVTCPNEMVALSAAQGYAQVTGKPAAVIVQCVVLHWYTVLIRTDSL